MKIEPYMNDLLDPKIRNLEDLTNHFELVDRLQKSFYFKFDYDEDEILTNESLPLTETSMKMFKKALEELNCANEMTNGKQKFSKFNLKYATRLSRKSFISPYCFILALIYIKRLKQINPIYVKSQSACDLFLISLIVSSKFLYEENTDEEIFNGQWATISGIDKKKLNEMEIVFLFNLNWQAYVGPAEFMEELIKIENLVIQNECKKRSYQFITYNELIRIFDNDKAYQRLVSNFLKFISKFILLASFTYSSVILALVLLSKSTMLQNNLIQHRNLINQTHYSDYGYLVSDSSTVSSEGDQSNDELTDELNASSELSSKSLNLNKLNSLDLNELNNNLNILNRQEDGLSSLKGLAIDVYTIHQADNGQRCEFNNNFNELIATLSNRSPVGNENHSDHHFKKVLNLYNIRKLFLVSKVY